MNILVRHPLSEAPIKRELFLSDQTEGADPSVGISKPAHSQKLHKDFGDAQQVKKQV